MRVMVTGSGGYVGSVLVPMLKAAGHIVECHDIGWFGPSAGFDFTKLEQCDHDFQVDAIIHLAAVANDPSAELDPLLTWQTNAFGTMNLAEKAAEAGVRQFIYASSGSVYGVSDKPCDESAPCVPLSAYNETKKVAERALLSYADRMAVQIVRPGTVCGVSPRQRLDVLVNTLVAEAFKTGRMVLKSPNAMRPHIHIDDMCALYLWLLERPAIDGTWNAGFENLSVMDVARIVGQYCNAEIIVEGESNDPRSYWMDSTKLLNAGFVPKHTVRDAVREVLGALTDGRVKDEDRCYNIRTMRAMHAA